MLRPDWPAPAGVQAICSERAGGVSPPPYDSLNLGDHVGDRAEAVQANRAHFAASLGARPVFLKQVHGDGVLRLDAHMPDGAEADACWTAGPGIACTIMVADCLPVLLCTGDGRRVGAAHCGWRGLAGQGGVGVLETLWAAMAQANGVAVAPDHVMAWLGPCIGPKAFEVGPEVRSAFVTHDGAAAEHFVPHTAGKFLCDLPALARQRLAALGIRSVHGNDGSDPWCTVSNPSRFFSHRRDRVSGRFAASIWRTG